jgi:hypothetical protein
MGFAATIVAVPALLENVDVVDDDVVVVVTCAMFETAEEHLFGLVELTSSSLLGFFGILQPPKISSNGEDDGNIAVNLGCALCLLWPRPPLPMTEQETETVMGWCGVLWR